MNQTKLSGNLANSTIDPDLATFDDLFGNHSQRDNNQNGWNNQTEGERYIGYRKSQENRCLFRCVSILYDKFAHLEVMHYLPCGIHFGRPIKFAWHSTSTLIAPIATPTWLRSFLPDFPANKPSRLPGKRSRNVHSRFRSFLQYQHWGWPHRPRKNHRNLHVLGGDLGTWQFLTDIHGNYPAFEKSRGKKPLKLVPIEVGTSLADKLFARMQARAGGIIPPSIEIYGKLLWTKNKP